MVQTECALTPRQQRIRQVRQQEKLIAESRCERYRQKLLSLKSVKHDVKRQQRTELLVEKFEEANYLWTNALLQTAESHFAAKSITKCALANTLEIKNKVNNQSEVTKRRKSEAYAKITKAINEKKLNDENLQSILELKNQFNIIDRENARAAAESKRCADALMSISIVSNPPIIRNQRFADQSAEAVYLRGSQPVNVKVIRHGFQPQDKSSIVSKVEEEVKETTQRLWHRVMNELITSKKVRDRASVAKKMMQRNSSASLLEQGLDHLQNEDRSVERLAVPRNMKVVVPVVESTKMLQDFENIFIPMTSATATSTSAYGDGEQAEDFASYFREHGDLDSAALERRMKAITKQNATSKTVRASIPKREEYMSHFDNELRLQEKENFVTNLNEFITPDPNINFAGPVAGTTSAKQSSINFLFKNKSSSSSSSSPQHRDVKVMIDNDDTSSRHYLLPAHQVQLQSSRPITQSRVIIKSSKSKADVVDNIGRVVFNPSLDSQRVYSEAQEVPFSRLVDFSADLDNHHQGIQDRRNFATAATTTTTSGFSHPSTYINRNSDNFVQDFDYGSRSDGDICSIEDNVDGFYDEQSQSQHSFEYGTQFVADTRDLLEEPVHNESTFRHPILQEIVKSSSGNNNNNNNNNRHLASSPESPKSQYLYQSNASSIDKKEQMRQNLLFSLGISDDPFYSNSGKVDSSEESRPTNQQQYKRNSGGVYNSGSSSSLRNVNKLSDSSQSFSKAADSDSSSSIPPFNVNNNDYNNDSPSSTGSSAMAMNEMVHSSKGYFDELEQKVQQDRKESISSVDMSYNTENTISRTRPQLIVPLTEQSIESFFGIPSQSPTKSLNSTTSSASSPLVASSRQQSQVTPSSANNNARINQPLSTFKLQSNSSGGSPSSTGSSAMAMNEMVHSSKGYFDELEQKVQRDRKESRSSVDMSYNTENTMSRTRPQLVVPLTEQSIESFLEKLAPSRDSLSSTNSSKLTTSMVVDNQNNSSGFIENDDEDGSNLSTSMVSESSINDAEGEWNESSNQHRIVFR